MSTQQGNMGVFGTFLKASIPQQDDLTWSYLFFFSSSGRLIICPWHLLARAARSNVNFLDRLCAPSYREILFYSYACMIPTYI